MYVYIHMSWATLPWVNLPAPSISPTIAARPHLAQKSSNRHWIFLDFCSYLVSVCFLHAAFSFSFFLPDPKGAGPFVANGLDPGHQCRLSGSRSDAKSEVATSTTTDATPRASSKHRASGFLWTHRLKRLRVLKETSNRPFLVPF